MSIAVYTIYCVLHRRASEQETQPPQTVLPIPANKRVTSFKIDEQEEPSPLHPLHRISTNSTAGLSL